MHCKSYSHFFSKKFPHICVSLDVNLNESLTNDVVSFEQLGPDNLDLYNNFKSENITQLKALQAGGCKREGGRIPGQLYIIPHELKNYKSHNVIKIPSDMFAQRRLKKACASAHSDQSLCCPHVETLHPWLSKMRPIKILVRLHECAG